MDNNLALRRLLYEWSSRRQGTENQSWYFDSDEQMEKALSLNLSHVDLKAEMFKASHQLKKMVVYVKNNSEYLDIESYFTPRLGQMGVCYTFHGHNLTTMQTGGVGSVSFLLNVQRDEYFYTSLQSVVPAVGILVRDGLIMQYQYCYYAPPKGEGAYAHPQEFSMYPSFHHSSFPCFRLSVVSG